MADFTVASRIGQGVGQNAFAGGGTQMNPLNMMQLMQTMELQRAAEQRALAGEARAAALHGPTLEAANLRVKEARLGLGAAERTAEDAETADKALQYMADNPDWASNYNKLRKSDAKLWNVLDTTAQKKAAAELASSSSRIDYDKKRFDLNNHLAETMAAVAPTVKDQAGYERWLKPLLQNNPEIANSLPAEYSPENFGMAKSVVDRLRQFKVVRLPTGDDAVFDPVEKKFISTLTEAGPQPYAGPQPAPAVAPTGAPTGMQPRAAGPLSPEAATMTTNALRRFEGFRAQPYWDVDAYRTGYGSDTITTPDGRVVKVQPGMTVTREDAERDLARRRTEFASTAARQAGEAWNNLPPGAHAGLTSVAYNYGSLPSRVLGAVRSGDTEAIARAVEGLAMDNNGINYARRMQEAAMIRGQAMPAAAGSPAVSASIGATERGMMGQPQAPANAMVPIVAAQLMQPQNAMAAQPQALPNIAPGLAQPAAAPATGVATPALTPAQQAKVASVGAETKARAEAEAKVKKDMTAEERAKSKAEFDALIDNAIDSYRDLRTGGYLQERDKDQGYASRAVTYASTVLPPGAVSVVNPARGGPLADLEQTRTLLVTALMNATGMGASQINSDTELSRYLAAMSSPSAPVSSIVKQLNALSKRFGSGRTFTEADFGEPPAPKERGKAGAFRELSAQDQQALDWANSNPKDPRAAEIKKRLGVR